MNLRKLFDDKFWYNIIGWYNIILFCYPGTVSFIVRPVFKVKLKISVVLIYTISKM